MNIRIVQRVLLGLTFLGVGLVFCAPAGAQEGSGADQLRIVCNGLQLSIDAENILPEQLFIELGRQCNIKIIAHGDVFPEQNVTIHFKDMPVRDGVRRLVKACSLRNYLMDFQRTQGGHMMLNKIDIFLGGSGTRILTRPETTEETAPVSGTTPADIAGGDDLREIRNMRQRRSFTEDTDFMWDGNAPIAFPEFTGEIDFGKSQYDWDDAARVFAEKTMDLVPPSVRD